jgi:dTDP-4-dehydrorhamnose reductase
MRTLITGAGGLLGHELIDTFAGAVAPGHADLDVTDEHAIRQAVRTHRPDIVVHAAAFTQVDACETQREQAWRVNASGAWNVARACAEAGAVMVYLSTDYVFDGSAGRPYTTRDTPAPLSVYGRTKAAGEELVRSSLETHYVVRTSWLQGAHGRCFVDTMLRLAGERDELSVVDDQVGCPTFAVDLAPAIRQLVTTERWGTYHVTNAGSCSWFEFAREIFAIAGIDVAVHPIDTASYGAPAPRPRFSVLDGSSAAQAGVTALAPWQHSLRSLIADREGEGERQRAGGRGSAWDGERQRAGGRDRGVA